VEGLQSTRRFHVVVEQNLAARTEEVFGTRVAERLTGDKERVVMELQLSVSAQLDRAGWDTP
jgi:hypothetical protein